MPVRTTHPLVADYLARLDAMSAGLAPVRRAELRAEIAEHLAAALPPGVEDAEVHEVLDRLGDPADIVAAEDGQAPPAAAWAPPASPWGPLEIAAVALLSVGLVLLPVVGPLLGLLLAWASSRWTLREKAVASAWTLLPAMLLFVGLLALSTMTDQPSPAPTRVDPVRVEPSTQGVNP